MEDSGIVNESSLVYHLFKKMIESQKDVVVVMEDEVDVDRIFEIAGSIRNLFDNMEVEVVKFLAEMDSIKRAIDVIYYSRKRKFIIASKKSINYRFPRKDNINSFSLKVGNSIKRNELVNFLVYRGFRRVNFVESTGEFATRGLVVDIFEFGNDYPYRIYFDGDKIEAIKKFDIESQNTFDFTMEVNISDLTKKEMSLYEMDLLKYSYNFSLDDITPIYDNSFNPEKGYFRNIKFYDFRLLKKEIDKFFNSGFKIYIFCLNDKEVNRISRVFEENEIPFKGVSFLNGYIGRGFYSKNDRILILSSDEIFNREYEYENIRKKAKKIYRLTELSYGDYVVCEDYGIGIFRGITELKHRDEMQNVYISECIEIEYAKGDRLFISLDDFKKVHKYIGGDGKKIKLSSLNSISWKRLKENVRKEVESIAKEIIKTQAKRKVKRIKPMLKTPLEEDFELDFPYQETPDQIRAINDVMKDLESGEISSRVIVGDVGFGKTEVIMRAIFRAVTNGFQACVLCPTTILSEQHYRNFKKRFEKYQINVDVVSRLTGDLKLKEIVSNVESGIIDVLIGTHKILSEKIKFKNLGLIVVDEEHKFGVRQKEEIKKKQELAHVIYLSATPIPRTLYLALTEIKSMSVIETPPLGRLGVQTQVLEYDENVIITAVNNELKRNGQIFYVYNKVEFIDNKAKRLSDILPGVRIGVIHGQMDKNRIEDTMIDFLNRKYDILLSSTIIESGIDIPTVNTLIVEDAHQLGLSQLYQLRGRIGREKKKAYCYLFFPKWLNAEREKNSQSDMMKRLFALEEFSELGSGFRLSMRDLEIRGAGELLGLKQHGFINSIGLDMYIKILNNEIKKIKGEDIRKEYDDILIDLKITALIPSDYINDDLERLNLYKKISSSSIEEIDDVVKRMIDIAGPLPVEVKNLISIAKIKKTLNGKGIKKIVEKDLRIEFYFYSNYRVSKEDIERWQRTYRNDLNFFKTSNGDGFSIKINNRDRIEIIKEVFKIDV